MKKVLALLLSIAVLAGCSRGLDRTLDISSQEALNKSFESALAGANEKEAAILRAHMPSILMGLLAQSMTGNTKELSNLTVRLMLSNLISNELQKEQTKLQTLVDQRKAAEELQQIKLDNIVYSPPSVTFDVNNASSIPVRSMTVQVRLYLEGQTEPAAESAAPEFFENGLDVGKKARASVLPGGSFGGEGGFDKLSVKKAVNPRVDLQLIEVTDYDDKRIRVVDDAEMNRVESKIADKKAQLEVIAKK